MYTVLPLQASVSAKCGTATVNKWRAPVTLWSLSPVGYSGWFLSSLKFLQPQWSRGCWQDAPSVTPKHQGYYSLSSTEAASLDLEVRFLTAHGSLTIETNWIYRLKLHTWNFKRLRWRERTKRGGHMAVHKVSMCSAGSAWLVCFSPSVAYILSAGCCSTGNCTFITERVCHLT